MSRELDFDTLPSRLVMGAATQDLHRKAAIDLLIWHGFWLRRKDFTEACIMQDKTAGPAYIRWEAARAFAFGNPQASSSELAILDVAVSLGTDRYKLTGLGHAHLRAVAQAFAEACGVRLEPAPSGGVHNHPSFIPGDASCTACATETRGDD